ncbi:MAG: xanthine dehydrogenase family protein subunit M [Rhodospirillales bacterium]|nr:xanthine dehydrogenase family protein subunit M [Rhodospirillales bacterium]
MYDFKFQRPGGLAAALEAFQQADDGQFLAGGQTVIPVMKQRLAMPSDLIDLGALDELKGITVAGGIVSIGSMTTHAEVAASEDIRQAIPALADLASGIGDPHVRNRGTLGGSIANNDPAADYPAAVVALSATVHTDRRQISGDDFFTGMFETALEDGELITKVDFPVAEAAAYEKFENTASRYALVAVMVCRRAESVRVTVIGAGPCVFRVPEMEKALEAEFTSDALKDIAVSYPDLNTDLHASAYYRAHLIGVLTARAVKKAS